ncbi:MFS transporter [Streptomyces sp. NPDC059918]|uniref:MFS transporter n=1 Tax=unclassified Streptomyces TaxID=2593676 RepID=UPI003662C95D
MPATKTSTRGELAKPAHRDPNVLRWVVAYTASVVGNGCFFLALGWAASRTASPAEAGFVMAVGAVPRAVLMLGGGVIADRFSPRYVVIGSDMVRCAVILAAAAALALASPGLWLLVAVALVFGVADALFLPAVGALPARLADAEQVLRVQGMRSLAVRLGNSMGAPLAGLVMALSGPAAAFAVAGGLFALSLTLLFTVRIRALPVRKSDPEAEAEAEAGEADAKGMWQEMTSGLRYVRGQPLVRMLVLALVVVELGCVAPLSIGLVLLAGDRGWGASSAGWTLGTFSVGAAVSSLLLTTMGRLPRPGVFYIASLAAGSASIASLALAPSPLIAASLGAVGGLTLGLNGGISYALVQSACNPAYLGRVMSLLSLASFGVGPLALPVFGAAAAGFGTAPAFAVFGAVAGLGAVACLFSADVRHAELPN